MLWVGLSRLTLPPDPRPAPPPSLFLSFLSFSVLYSNIYNTNFPLYSVDDAWKFRFNLRPLAASRELAHAARAASVTRHAGASE